MHVDIHHLLHSYGYAGVFVILCMEMIGIPFPAETTLTISGFEWKSGAFALVPLLFSASLGNVVGSTIAYFIGYFLGRPVILRFGRFVGITEARLNAAEEKFAKYRGSIVLFAKFIAGIRILVPYLAGINRMPFLLFTLYNLVSAVAWAAFFIIVGRYVEVLWAHYHQFLRPYMWPVLGVLIVIAVVVVLVKRHKKSR